MTPDGFVGVDVSARVFDVVGEFGGNRSAVENFSNDTDGRLRFSKWLGRHGKYVRVVLESTGVYGLDLAVMLAERLDTEVMVANPRAIRHFHQAAMNRSKSDARDAATICEFAKRMDFVAWKPPSPTVLELRAIARRMSALTAERTRERNRLHAEKSHEGGSRRVLRNIEEHIEWLDEQLEQLADEGLRLIQEDESVARAYQHLTSIKGFAKVSAVGVLSELLVLPQDMTVRQWVAHAGLDPREHTSGSSVNKPPRISKVGNVHLRRALFMPALVAVQHEPRVKAYYEKLKDRGKKKLQALVAVMRKLLHAIYGMLRHDSDFIGEKFYASS